MKKKSTLIRKGENVLTKSESFQIFNKKRILLSYLSIHKASKIFRNFSKIF